MIDVLYMYWHLFASDSAQGVVGVKRSSSLPIIVGMQPPGLLNMTGE